MRGNEPRSNLLLNRMTKTWNNLPKEIMYWDHQSTLSRAGWIHTEGRYEVKLVSILTATTNNIHTGPFIRIFKFYDVFFSKLFKVNDLIVFFLIILSVLKKNLKLKLYL